MRLEWMVLRVVTVPLVLTDGVGAGGAGEHRTACTDGNHILSDAILYGTCPG
jgi:hypothetical protein